MIWIDDRIEKVRRFLDEQAVLRDRRGEIFRGQAIILFAGLFGLQLFAMLLRSLDTLLSPGGEKDLRCPEQGGKAHDP